MTTCVVASCQPDPGMRAVIVCSPSLREICAGVALPDGAPSTRSCAPSGKLVTRNTPLAHAGAVHAAIATIITAAPSIVLVLMRLLLRQLAHGWEQRRCHTDLPLF